MNTTIRTRFIFLQIFVALTIAIAATIVGLQLKPIQENWNHYLGQVESRQQLLGQIERNFGYGGIIHHFKNYQLRGAPDSLDRLKKNFSSLEDSLSGYQNINSLSAAEQSALDKVKQVARNYKLQSEKITEEFGKESPLSAMDKQVDIDDSPAFAAFKSLHQVIDEMTQSETERLGERIGRVTLYIIAGGISAILIVFGITFMMANSLTRQLDQIRIAIQKIEHDSDLDARINIEQDNELGQLATSFNALMNRFRDVIFSVIRSSAQVGVESARQSSLIDGTVAGVRQQYQEIDMVATAVNEMSASIQEVTRNTSSAAEAADKSSQEALTGKEVVSSVISSIGHLGQRMERMSNSISELEGDSQKIGTVLEVINSIAEQTNLLALNAAIEAARAGEHGRGFAVVADEVRGLASRTQESTDEIRTMIDRLASQVKEVVESTKLGHQDLKSASEQVSSAGSALDHIVDSTRTIHDMMTQIASATMEQSAVAEEVNRNIMSLSTIASTTAETADNTLVASAEISSKVEDLRAAATRFKISDQSLSLEQAKAAHLAWRGRVRQYLDGRGNLSSSQATSHHDCIFGQWYYSSGLERLGNIPEMKQIEAPHAEMHKAVKRAIECFENGDKSAAEEAYNRIEPCSNEVVHYIDEVLKKL